MISAQISMGVIIVQVNNLLIHIVTAFVKQDK